MLVSHSSLHYHRHCLEMANALMSSVDNPATWVDVMFAGTMQNRLMRINKSFERLCEQYFFFYLSKVYRLEET